MRTFGLLVAALVATTSLAHADAKALYAEGQDAYKKQNFALAATKFAAAYDADPDPVYLFNAAQAYRFGNDCVKSADYYARFFAKVPSPPNADKIHAWADEMATCARAKSPAPPIDHPITTTTPLDHPTTTPVTTEPPPDPDSHSHVLGYVALGAGVAGLVAGGVFTAGWHSAQSDSDGLCPSSKCKWDASFNGRLADDHTKAKRDSALAITGFGLGAVLVTTGAYLVFGAHGGEHAPTVTPTAGGATVSTTFRF